MSLRVVGASSELSIPKDVLNHRVLYTSSCLFMDLKLPNKARNLSVASDAVG